MLDLNDPYQVSPTRKLCESMSAVLKLSGSERQYILDGVRQDIREDGRSCSNARYYALKTDVVSNTSGSAKIDRVISMLTNHVSLQ